MLARLAHLVLLVCPLAVPALAGASPGPGQVSGQGARQAGAEPAAATLPFGQRLATPSRLLVVPFADPSLGRPGTRPELWREALAGVRHVDVFPGVDLVYVVDGPRLEAALLVEAGVDLASIHLDFPGLSALALVGAGDLVATTPPLYSLLRRPRIAPLNDAVALDLGAGWRRRGPEQVGIWAEGGDVTPAAVLIHFEADLFEVTLPDFAALAVDFGGSASMVDAILGDDGDGLGDPGETIRYTTTMTNAGDTTAQTTQLDATLDAATALVPGSLNISPLAINDAYTDVIGNVTFNVDAASGVLNNDRDPPAANCSTCTITSFDPMSANSGDVTLNGDGSFTYNPPTGFTGTDTFTYTVEDNHGTTPLSNAATVSLTVADVVWFVDNSAVAVGDGRQATPFQTLAEAEAATGPGAIIRVRRGDSGTTPYAGGITLQSQQQLIGGGVDLVVGTTTVETADGDAVITNAGGHVVTLASDDHVEGVELQPVASAGLYRTGALGTTTIDATTIAINGAGSDGIFLDNTAGALSFDNSTVSTMTAGTGIGVRVDGGSPTVAIGNSAVGKTGGRALDVLNTTAGTVTFTGGSLTSTNGLGLRVSNADGDVTINASTALSITGATGTPITIAGTAPGATTADVTIGGGTITTNNGAFPLISGTNSSGSLTLTNATLTHSGGRIVDFDDMDGGGSFSGTTVTNTDHDGVRIIDSAGTFASFFDVVVVNPPADAIVLQNNTSTVSFGLINVATNGAGIRGIFASNGGTVSVTNAASQIASTGGAAVDIDNTTLGMTFASVSSSNSNVAGIDLDTVGGSFVANGGMVSGATGVGVDINGGAGTITYAGNVTNATNRAVEITARAGGTLTLSGTINETGTGVSIANNTGGTINLSGSSKVLNTGTNIPLAITSNANATVNVTGGGLDIDATSATGLNVTGGGTLTVGGAGNTITTTTGTALNVASTTIGASGVTFQSISSNGAANGIVLNSTGSTGGLTVSGNGTAGSGGTIQNGTIGVSLTSTSSVSLDRMQLNDFGDYAIRGSGVAGFTMANTVVNGTNGNDGAADEGSVRFTELTGSATISDSNISGAVENNFRVVNTAGSLNRITFSRVTFGPMNAATGNDGLVLESLGNAVINATIDDSDFTHAAGDLFNFLNNGSATNDLVFTTNTLTNAHPAIATGGGGVTISGGDLGGSLTFLVSNNTFRDSDGHAILIVKSTGAGTYAGTFSGNMVGVAATPNSGSIAGSGLKVQNAGQGAMTIAILNNTIRQYNNFGVELLTGGGATAQSGALNATITGNTIGNPGTGGLPMNGIHLNAGTVPGDTYLVCADVGGAGGLANSVAGSGANVGTDIRLRQRQSTTVRLPGYGGGNTDVAAVQTYLAGRNGGNGAPTTLASVNSPPGGGFVNTAGGAACAQPF